MQEPPVPTTDTRRRTEGRAAPREEMSSVAAVVVLLPVSCVPVPGYFWDVCPLTPSMLYCPVWNLHSASPQGSGAGKKVLQL